MIPLAQPRVRVLVADDHEVMRLGIRNLLEVHPGWSVCAEANNGQEAVEKTLQFHPDVIIMDITMPVMNGLEAASQITQERTGNSRHSVLPAPFRRPVSSLQDRRNSRSGRQGRCGARSGSGGRNSIGRRNVLSRPESRFELTQDLGKVIRRGRRWPVMGSYQRLPFAPSRWGTFINTVGEPGCRHPEDAVDRTRKIAYKSYWPVA